MIRLYVLTMSIAGFILTALDKIFAVKDRFRVPEKTLLLLAALGGGPGSLAAMLLMRHKTRKPVFVGVFWVSAVLWAVLFVIAK